MCVSEAKVFIWFALLIQCRIIHQRLIGRWKRWPGRKLFKVEVKITTIVEEFSINAKARLDDKVDVEVEFVVKISSFDRSMKERGQRWFDIVGNIFETRRRREVYISRIVMSIDVVLREANLPRGLLVPLYAKTDEASS